MKYILTGTALLLFTLTAFAQLDKKTWQLGETGSFYTYHGEYTSTSNTRMTKVTSIDIKASIGYSPIDKFVVGLRPAFSYSKGHTFVNGI